MIGNYESLSLAVVVLVVKEGTVLAVSRKNDPTAFGLPGGKVEVGEYLEQAAKRELFEETGLTAVNLRPIFTQEDGDYLTVTFTCDVMGDIKTDELGVVCWVEPKVLISGPFRKYNTQLFEHVMLMHRQRFYQNKTATYSPFGVRETSYQLTPEFEKNLLIKLIADRDKVKK